MPTRHLATLVLLLGVVCGPSTAASGDEQPQFLTFEPISIELGILDPGGFALAGHPEGGWLAAWGAWSFDTPVRARRIFPDGTLGEVVETSMLGESHVEMVAVGPSGRWVLLDQALGISGDGSYIFANLLEPDGELVRWLQLPIGAHPHNYQSGRVAVMPDGGFVVALSVPTAQTGGNGSDLYIARFSPDGERLGEPLVVNEPGPGRHLPIGLAVTSETIVLLWVSWASLVDPDLPARILVSLLSHELSPRDPIEVAGERLVAHPDGRFLIARMEAQSPTEGVWFVRPFRANGTPGGPEVPVVVTEPRRERFSMEATPAGTVWLSWFDDSDRLIAQPFAIDGQPLSAARPTGVENRGPVYSAADSEGRMLFIAPWGSTGAVLPAPPPEQGLTSPRVPGFRVWVRITARSGEARWGAAEPQCLTETLCASGALPGRTEVLVRVIGPRPNGFLWPTLVKLTTSQVEVWIEQLATAELRYYLLPGATSGDDTLPGLFDRFGFAPE
jgi:hypothetical protein